jgi:sigma-B regulation protein RsbU (phosphoserine phosphatase)
VRQALAAVLEPYSPLVAADGIEARDILRDTLVDVVVCDLSMPRLDGLSLMRWAKEHAAHPIWIVLSAHDTFDTAVQAMQLGAFDFLQKPLASSAVLETVVANALRQQALVAEQARLRQDLAETNLRVAEALSRVQAAYQVLLEQRAMVEQDFRRAERIQRALLPRVLPRLDGVQVNVAFRPSTVIGGDLYGADMLDDRHLAVYVADAAGHGVSAALLIVLFNQRLRTKDEAGPRSPAAVLADLNRDLHRECSASGLFITVAYALIDTVTHEIRISSAGHPSCLVLREDGSSVSVETTGPALGLTPDATFGETRLFSGEGDRLLFHTDGLTQALPPGAPPLASLVRAAIADGCDGATTVDRLLAWTDGETAERGDDVTILLVTARSGASTMNARTSEAPPAPRAADSPLSTVTVSDTTFVAVRGRGTWTHGPSLQETCVEALDAGRRVVVDLGACVSLDSTLLGTLYALARRAEERGAFHLQNVPGDVRRAFVELSLEPVLAAISDEPVPLGDDMMPLRAKDDRTAQDLLLHAHEILAAITPGNATEFGGVVEALRAASPP